MHLHGRWHWKVVPVLCLLCIVSCWTAVNCSRMISHDVWWRQLRVHWPCLLSESFFLCVFPNIYWFFLAFFEFKVFYIYQIYSTIVIFNICSLSSVLKSYGQQLKAPAAMVRLRLYETLTLLPANSLESSYTHLLRMLVSEFTLTENPANTTNSLLRELCHSDDSIILGSWLQEIDHKTIEDQVISQIFFLFTILVHIS